MTIHLVIGEDEICLFDLSEIAKIMSLRRETVWKYVKESRLPAQFFRGRWWVSKENLLSFINGKTAVPEAAEMMRQRGKKHLGKRENLKQFRTENRETLF